MLTLGLTSTDPRERVHGQLGNYHEICVVMVAQVFMLNAFFFVQCLELTDVIK